MTDVHARLAELGLELPEAAAPVAAYVPTVTAGGVTSARAQSDEPPTAAAPINFQSIVSAPVLTLASNVLVATSYTPTTSALHGAKITLVPTAAAPRNL